MIKMQQFSFSGAGKPFYAKLQINFNSELFLKSTRGGGGQYINVYPLHEKTKIDHILNINNYSFLCISMYTIY